MTDQIKSLAHKLLPTWLRRMLGTGPRLIAFAFAVVILCLTPFFSSIFDGARGLWQSKVSQWEFDAHVKQGEQRWEESKADRQKLNLTVSNVNVTLGKIEQHAEDTDATLKRIADGQDRINSRLDDMYKLIAQRQITAAPTSMEERR